MYMLESVGGVAIHQDASRSRQDGSYYRGSSLICSWNSKLVYRGKPINIVSSPVGYVVPAKAVKRLSHARTVFDKSEIAYCKE